VYEREAGVQAAEAEGRRLGGRLDAALAAADKAKLDALAATKAKTLCESQLRTALRCAQEMWASACEPQIAAASGLGLVLKSASEEADHGCSVEVGEVLMAGPAESSGCVKVGDGILEVAGDSTNALTLEEVEERLAGPVFSKVSIKAASAGGDAYEVELERGCGSHASQSSALERLATHMQPETCQEAEKMRQELERLRDTTKKDHDTHDAGRKAWREKEARLDAEIAELTRQLAASETNLQDLSATSAAREQRLDDESKAATDRLNEARAALTQAGAELDAARAEIASLKTEVLEGKVAVEKAQAELQRALQEAEAAGKDSLAAREAEALARGETSAAEAKLAEALARQRQLEAALQEAQRAHETMKCDLEQLEKERGSLTEQVGALEQAAADRAREIAAAQAAADKARKDNAQTQSELAREGTRAADLSKDLAAAEALVEEKRREIQQLQDAQVALKDEVSRAGLRASEAQKQLAAAAADMGKARQTAAEGVAALQERVMRAAKTAEAMYVAVCRPSVGSAAGLGLVLSAAADDRGQASRHPQIAEVVAGGAAGGKLQDGDVLLAVDGAATQDLPVSEVEGKLAGKVGTQVKLRAQAVGAKKPYECVLVRGLSADAANLDALVASLVPEAVKASNALHDELDALRAQVNR